MDRLQDLDVWKEMNRQLSDFKKGKTILHKLVVELGWTLEKAESAAGDWVERCYEIWNSLEEIDLESLHEMEADYGRAHALAAEMAAFLREQISLLKFGHLPDHTHPKTMSGHAA